MFNFNKIGETLKGLSLDRLQEPGTGAPEPISASADDSRDGTQSNSALAPEAARSTSTTTASQMALLTSAEGLMKAKDFFANWAQPSTVTNSAKPVAVPDSAATTNSQSAPVSSRPIAPSPLESSDWEAWDETAQVERTEDHPEKVECQPGSKIDASTISNEGVPPSPLVANSPDTAGLRDKNAKLKKLCKDLRDVATLKTEQLAAVQEALVEEKKTTAELQTQMEALKSRIRMSDETTQATTALQSRCAVLEADLSLREAKQKDEESKNSELNLKTRALENKIQELSDYMSSADQQISLLKQQQEVLLSTNSQQAQELAVMTQRIQQFIDRENRLCNAAKDNQSRYEVDISDLKRINEDLRNQLLAVAHNTDAQLPVTPMSDELMRSLSREAQESRELRKKLDDVKTMCEDVKAQVMNEIGTHRAVAESLREELQKYVEGSIVCEQVEHDRNLMSSQLSALEEENRKLAEKTEEDSVCLHKLRLEIESLFASARQDENEKMSLLQQLQAEVNRREELEKVHSELEEEKQRNSRLTEKLKEFMKKCNEEKTRANEEKAHAQALQEELDVLKKKHDQMAFTLGRQVEKLSMQLSKRDNVVEERSHQLDSATKVAAESAEKNLRYEKEIKQLNERLQACNKSMEEQQKVLGEVQQSLELQLATTVADKEELVVQIARTAREHAAELRIRNEQQRLLEQQLKEIQDVLAVRNGELLQLRQQLQVQEEQEQSITKQLEQLAENESHFKEYKKRTQTMLKQANEKAAALGAQIQQQADDFSAEISDKESKLDALQTKIVELTSALKAESEHVQDMRLQLQETKNKVSSLTEDNSELYTKYEASQQSLQEAMTRIDQLTLSAAETRHLPHESIKAPHTFTRANIESSFNFTEPVEPDSGYFMVSSEIPGGWTQSPRHSTLTPKHSLEIPSLIRGVSDRDTIDIEGSDLAVELPSSEGVFLIDQLRAQLDVSRKEASDYASTIDKLQEALRTEQADRQQLQTRLEELLGFSERVQTLGQGSDSAINLQYLKNCVLSYMLARERSEQQRVSLVIATILKFTSEEKRDLQRVLQQQNTPMTAITSWLGPFN